MQREQFVWVEKWRPKTLSECILPASVQHTLEGIVTQQDTANLLLCGKAGTGKTTVAKALVNDFGTESLVINASDENGIDVIRTKVKQFASAMSLSDGRRFVILDEADYLHPQSTQPALRAFIEEFSHTCGFILTANYPQRIIPPIHSRCSVVDFKIPKQERQDVMIRFTKRAFDILNAERVTYDKKVVAEVIAMYFPDFRRVLNELQRYSSSGTLSDAVLSQISDKDVNELFKTMKSGTFSDVRLWIANHDDIDDTTFYRMLSEQITSRVKEDSLPELIIQLADYGYRAGLCADKQLNNLACLVEVMHSAKWN